MTVGKTGGKPNRIVAIVVVEIVLTAVFWVWGYGRFRYCVSNVLCTIYPTLLVVLGSVQVVVGVGMWTRRSWTWASCPLVSAASVATSTWAVGVGFIVVVFDPGLVAIVPNLAVIYSLTTSSRDGLPQAGFFLRICPRTTVHSVVVWVLTEIN